MNYIDIIIAVPILYGIIKGFFNGLIKEITGFLGFLFGVYIAVNFSSYLYPKFTDFLGGYEDFVPIISFAVLFIVSIITIRLLGYFLDKLAHSLALGFVSKMLGAIFGGIKIMVILSFLLVIATDHQLIDKKIEKTAVLIGPLQKATEVIIPEINKHKKEVLEKAKKNTQKAKEKLENKINLE